MKKTLLSLFGLLLCASQAFAQTFPGVGPWINSPNPKVALYTANITDCGTTIALGGAASYTLTIGSASGYTTDCVIVVANTDAAQNKTIATSGLSNVTLTGGQGIIVYRSGSTWFQGLFTPTAGGGGGTPGGSNTQVQFNSSGAFGGSTNLTWVSPALTIGTAGATMGQLAMTSANTGTTTLQSTAGQTASYNFNFPITAGTSGQPLLSGGGGSTAQTYSSITYPGSATSGGIPFFSSTTAMGTSGLLALNGVVYGGGAGAAPGSTSAALNGSLIVGNAGVAPSFVQMSQDCALSSATPGQITCTKSNNVSFGPLATQAIPCTLTQGCTGAITAQGARANSGGTGINVDSCTSTGDANYVILTTDRCVYHSSLTVARTDTLPAANSVNAGQIFYLTDFAGQASGVKTVTLLRAGADTINGSTSQVAISAQYGAALYWSDGTSRWTFLPTGVGGGGTVTSVTCNGLTIAASGTCPESFHFENCSLAASVGSTLLTVALKDASGADASGTSVCRIGFRNSTATTGSITFDSVTSALSISTNATGATLGSVNNKAFRFWVVAFDNGGTVVLSLVNASTATQCFPVDETNVQSSTAMSAGATSAGVYYTPNGTTLSSKPIRILGYVEYNSTGLATAGNYQTSPNFIQVFGPGVKKPCEPVSNVDSNFTTASNTASAMVGANDTIPQLTDGAQITTQAITMSSAANRVKAKAFLTTAASANVNYWIALFEDSVANALTAVFINTPGLDSPLDASLAWSGTPNVLGSTTFKLRIGNVTGASATIGWNGVSNARRLGGSQGVVIELTEIQG